jgi:ADP-ribose pyrophosphatase YjhB (NUDIX family)
MSSHPAAMSNADWTETLAALAADRRWHAQSAPAPIVIAFIRRTRPAGDEFLLIRRNKPPYAGQWALVGGKWDFGETLAEAITREVREETGLTTALVAVRAVVSERVVPRSEDELAAHFLLLVCDLRVVDGEAAAYAEGEVAWFAPAAVAGLAETGAIIPSDHAMFHAYAASAAAVPLAEVVMQAPATLLSFIRVEAP